MPNVRRNTKLKTVVYYDKIIVPKKNRMSRLALQIIDPTLHYQPGV